MWEVVMGSERLVYSITLSVLEIRRTWKIEGGRNWKHSKLGVVRWQIESGEGLRIDGT